LRYTFGNADGFFAFTFRDQSAYRDLSAALTSFGGPHSSYRSFAGSALQGHNAGDGFDVRTPLGSTRDGEGARSIVLFRHFISLSTQSVVGPAAGSSPHLFDTVDRLGEDSLQIDRVFSKAVVSLKLTARTEQLATQQIVGAARWSIKRTCVGLLRPIRNQPPIPIVCTRRNVRASCAPPTTPAPSCTLHAGRLAIEDSSSLRIGYRAAVSYEDAYNGLNRPGYATLEAGLRWHLPSAIDLGLFGTNLTNVYADRFTLLGAGTRYSTLDEPASTDAYALAGRRLSLIVTRRF